MASEQRRYLNCKIFHTNLLENLALMLQRSSLILMIRAMNHHPGRPPRTRKTRRASPYWLDVSTSRLNGKLHNRGSGSITVLITFCNHFRSRLNLTPTGTRHGTHSPSLTSMSFLEQNALSTKRRPKIFPHTCSNLMSYLLSEASSARFH